MLIQKLNEAQIAEMIERHAEFVEETNSVCGRFTFMRRLCAIYESGRSRAAYSYGVSSLPIVLRNGDMLTGRGLDRRSGIVFECHPIYGCRRAKNAIRILLSGGDEFLCDEWLCDVRPIMPGSALSSRAR